jgi:hypothetical protein
MKKAQKVLENYRDKCQSWLQFNRRMQELKSFALSEITNMDQTPICFKFLSSKTYVTKRSNTV